MQFDAFASPARLRIPIQKYHLLIEHAFTPATHPTVTGYQQIGSHTKPVFAPEPSNTGWQRYINTLHTEATAAARRLHEANIDLATIAARQNDALHNLSRFVRNPTAAEVRSIADIPTTRIHANRPQHQLNAPLASPLSLPVIWNAIRDMRKCTTSPPTIIPWLEGAAVISRWPLRVAARPLIGGLRRVQTR